ncbi:MAG: pyridoxal-phosphate dependent enzyme [Calditrichaeota bacterium]|nr:pyridoxal-phosphate dependent enzyme [Calditrichota bacterium]
MYSETTVKSKSALRRIKKYIRHTPLDEFKELSQQTFNKIFLKLENWQETGSFKVRGALNRMLTLSEKEKSDGVITASAGNHGLGVAYASELLGIKARIVAPVSAAPTKIQMLHNFGVEVVQAGRDYDESEDVAHRIENDCQLTFVHAFEDPYIIAGQGTIALEILESLPEADMIVVPVGGGGLISGVAIAAKQIKSNIKIIGVQSEASPAMYRAWKSNQAIESPIRETVADGLAGRLVSPTMLATVQKYVDDFVLVSEEEIVDAMLYLLETKHILVEGAAAVGIAAVKNRHLSGENENIAIVISGRNIDLKIVKKILRT